MSWSYRIVKRPLGDGDGDYFALCEVYYDEGGNPTGVTHDPISFVADDAADLIASLELALNDAKNRPVLDEAATWPKLGEPVGIVIEDAGASFSAYVPDLPGCVSAGETVQETKAAIVEAIVFHREGLALDANEPLSDDIGCGLVRVVYAKRDSDAA